MHVCEYTCSDFELSTKYTVIGSLDLDLLHKCHRMQTSVLHKYNQDLARTNDAIAHAYASRGVQHQSL